VLVEGVGQEGLAADVAPVSAGGEVSLPDVFVGKRRVMIVGDCVPFQYLEFIQTTRWQ